MLYDFDWNDVLKNLPLQGGESKTPSADFYRNLDGRFDSIINQWKQAGYDQCDSVEWINYYPDSHYNSIVAEKFSIWSNSKCARNWISRMRPGKMAPFHQDIDDNLEEYLAMGELVRFSVFISQPSPGGLFLLKEQVYHNEPQGKVIMWDDYLDWHAGVNCGLTDKFMFHYLGVKNEK